MDEYRIRHNGKKHDKRANIYEVEVSSEIMPYLVALAENFTSYDLTVAISLKVPIQNNDFMNTAANLRTARTRPFFFSVDDLKKMMMLEDKKGYDNSSNFKTKVLDVAQKRAERSIR